MFNLHIKMIIFILSIILVTLIVYFASFVSFKSKFLRKYIAGKPTTIIENGKILEGNMTKLKYSYDYLFVQLRQHNVFDVSHVEYAILEPNGKLSVQLKSQNRPVTPKDMHIPTQYEGLATEIILDGRVIKKQLEAISLSSEWLNERLKERGVEDIQKVAFAALSSDGNLYIDFYEEG